MTRSTRHYRLRIRNADDSADALILTNVPGGTNPYITGPPEGDGQEINPATGESSIGAYAIETADVSEVVTAALVDASGRQTLIQRRAYIELSEDGGSSWPIVLVPGFVNGYRLVTAMRWAFTIGESRRIEHTQRVWVSTSENFEQATCLIGGPIRGNWGPMVDPGGWRFKVSDSDSDTVTLRFYDGTVPIHESTPKDQMVTPLEDDYGALTAFARRRANELAAPEVELAEAAAGDASFPGIVVLVQNEAGTEVDRFTPCAQAGLDLLPYVLLTRLDEIKLLRAGTVWSGSPPSNGTIFRLYAWRTTIGEDNPLHITAHPIDILTDLWGEVGIAYDSTEATSVRTALGTNTLLLLRITEPWKLREVEEMLGGLFGFSTRVGSDGELELVITRIRGISAPSNSYDDDDLRSIDTVIFAVDEESVYNHVVVEQLRFQRWGPGLGDRPVDDVVGLTRIRSFSLDSEGGGTPDSETFGIRELRFEVPGTVAIDVSGQALGDRYYEEGLAAEIFDRFGHGGLYSEIAALPTITEKVGDEFLLDVSHLPNAGVRGGERILQVVRRTETPSGPILRLLDSGPDSQFGTSPTFSVAAGAADARKYVDVTISNASTLNAADACLRIEWAVAATEPTSGSLLTEYGVGQIPSAFTTPAVDAGSHVWMRMRAYQPGKRSTAWTAWDDVDLTDLTAPSSLDDTPGSDPALITITFTPGESDIPLEVWQRPQGDPASEARLVDQLPAGSDRVTLTLVPGNSYTIGIRHRETPPFQGVSSTTEISFTVAGSADTLDAPTNPYALGIKWTEGSLGGSSRIPPLDWQGDPNENYAVGIRVRSAIEQGFVDFEFAVETAVGSGTPGSYTSVELRPVTGVGETYVFMMGAPLDGKHRYFRARHSRAGATASSYTSVVSVIPGEILSPPADVNPIEITDVVPTTLGGTGVADPTTGVLLVGAGASPVTELAPAAAGGYTRSDGSTWTRSDLLATDLTGTIASARLSGIYSGITGLGTQAQALDMNGQNITNVSTISSSSNLILSPVGETFVQRSTTGSQEDVFAVRKSDDTYKWELGYNTTLDCSILRCYVPGYSDSMYLIGYGTGHASAGQFAMKSIDASGSLGFYTGGNNLRLEITASGVVLSNDLTIGSLGVFDSTDTPSDRQFLIYNDAASKWQAESIQLAWGGSDIKAAVLADNTAVTYILDDPGTGADSPAGAPGIPDAPVLYGAHESITLEVVDYSRPADFRYFQWRYSTDNFVADDNALATTTSDKIVHARLDNATTYYYKVRAVDRYGNTSSYSSVSSTTPTENGAQAFGVVLAAEIGVANLSSIQADIGIITAGQMRDSTNVYGLNLGGAGGIPGTWAAGVNFENTAVDGMDRYINFYEGSSDGLDYFIKHERFELKHDGSAVFYDVVDILEGTLVGGAFGDKHIFLRDPSLTHGMTSIVETDIAGALGLNLASGSGAGLGMVGFSDGNRALSVGGVATTPSTAWGSLAVTTFESWKKSGTSRGVVADGELAFGWQNGTNALMALWGDGSLAVAGPVTLRYDGSNYTTFTVASAGDLSITCTGSDPDRFGVVLGSTERMAIDDTAVSGETSLYLYDPAITGLNRVKVGANGTGPSGNERALYMDEIPA